MKKTGILAHTEAIIGGIIRVVPHPMNFTPVGGLTMYCGARLSGWKAFGVPFIIMAVTDIILHFTNGYPLIHETTVFVYGAYALNVMLGRIFLQNSDNPAKLFGVATVGSVQFFLITNFGTWLVGGIYPLTAAGLSACFLAAIPFYQATILGDLFFTGVFFGVHHLAAQRWFQSELAGHAA